MITTGLLCDSCDTEVFWARTERGKAMLVDAGPCEDGNLEVIQHDGVVQVRVLRGGEGVGSKRYRSHFVSCPRAGEHRKRGNR